MACEVGDAADKGIVNSTRECDAVEQRRRIVLAVTSGEAPFQAKRITVSIELGNSRSDKMNYFDPVAVLNTSLLEGRGRKKHHGLLDFNDIVELRCDNFLPIIPTATACA